jgi:hypothetical protein
MKNTPQTPATHTVTRSVCRTGYAHKDVSAEVPVGASEADIEHAILDAAPILAFNEKHSEYSLTFSDPACKAEDTQRRALVLILQGLADLGFGTMHQDIEIDAIDEIADLLDTTLTMAGVSRRLIHSESNNGYWNQTFKQWVEEGTYYFGTTLPAGMPADAKLVDLELKESFGRPNECPPGATLDLVEAIDHAKGFGDCGSIQGAIALLEQRVDETDSERDQEALRTLRLVSH